MTRLAVIECDRCHSTSESEPLGWAELNMPSEMVRDVNIAKIAREGPGPAFVPFDLCPSCAGKLRRFLLNMAGQP